MIQSITPNQYTKQNTKPISFSANFECLESAYKPINETYAEIAKFRKESGANFKLEDFIQQLKENFEKATEKTLGDVTIYKEYLSEGISVAFRDAEGKRIVSSIPALKLFKKDGPNHEILIDELKSKYNKVFEETCLPKSNPFEN